VTEKGAGQEKTFFWKLLWGRERRCDRREETGEGKELNKEAGSIVKLHRGKSVSGLRTVKKGGLVGASM